MTLVKVFADLLDSNPKEEDIHAFLASHPDLLMDWARVSGRKSTVRSKVNLHSFVTDFAIGNWRETTGRWEWTLVEIERPQHRLFTKQGDPTRELTHAVRQIVDWRSWIQNNLHFARTILPDIRPSFPASVVIGRRRDVDPQDRDRLDMLQVQYGGVSISTFDSFLDACETIREAK
jgi:hypothetical protein